MEPRRGIAAQEMFGLLIDCPTVAMERNRGVGTVLMPIKADFRRCRVRTDRDCFASLAMTKLKDCHAKSGGTKQSRSKWRKLTETRRWARLTASAAWRAGNNFARQTVAEIVWGINEHSYRYVLSNALGSDRLSARPGRPFPTNGKGPSSPTLVEMATELEMQADRLAKNLCWGKARLTERPHEIIYDRLPPDRSVRE
jgi:hypothetical protein